SIITSRTLISSAPEAERKPPKPTHPVVEIIEVLSEEYRITIHSRGTIAPKTEGTLVAEVAGRILSTSPNFQPGGWFKAGEVLLTLDPTDHQHTVTIAEAERSQAALALQKTEAEAAQAKQSWEQMALSGSPTGLTLYQPQLAEARAKLAAAEARLAQAQRDLERSQIIAPYTGRVLEQQVDRGQFITRGTALATLYATDLAEVRLPITDRQARFLILPEQGHQPPVQLVAHSTSNPQQWEGQIVRSEATIDPQTHQLYLIAQIQNPYTPQSESTPPLRIGQFVRAEIEGITLPQVFLIPRVAIREGNQVLVVDSENRIERRTLEVVWQQADQLIISSGLQAGERIILTSLPYAPDGMQVKEKSEQK
ncbi:MAG: efflux RND transporter periplasmic adaptor subunit, partial [Gammaproteobacteria bacterium]|nr:efflux RND transporter periplasmic adaptor subunit [Gammaproteobacteria bacterium]